MTDSTDNKSEEKFVCIICGKKNSFNDLVSREDIEVTHPRNKNNPNCNKNNLSGCHWTKFLQCDKCGRIVFADGIRI